MDRSDPLRVFVYDSGEEAPFTAGAYAMPTALIEAAGGVNIMDDLEKSWAEIGWEPVVERNPEVIVIVNYGDVTAEQKIAFLKGNPAFASIDAVQERPFRRAGLCRGDARPPQHQGGGKAGRRVLGQLMP